MAKDKLASVHNILSREKIKNKNVEKSNGKEEKCSIRTEGLQWKQIKKWLRQKGGIKRVWRGKKLTKSTLVKTVYFIVAI